MDLCQEVKPLGPMAARRATPRAAAAATGHTILYCSLLP